MDLIKTLRSLKGSRLVRATFTVAALSLFVKVIALVKDMVVAARFGVSREMDIYTLAFSIASFPVALLAGNLREAFIPVYVGLRSQDRTDEAWALHVAVRRRLVLAMICLGLGIGLTVPFWVQHLVPTWTLADRTRFHWVLTLLLVTLPQGGAIMLISATLQGQNRFTQPALSPGVTSLTIIAILALPLAMGAFQLGGGLVLGQAVEMAVLLWYLYRVQGAPAPVDPALVADSLRTVGRLYIPALGAGLFMCTTSLVDMLIAAWLPPGAISTLAYANKVPAVMITLSAGALGTTLFPAFSHLAGLGQWAQLRSKATRAFGLALAASVLVTLVLYAFSPLLVKLLFRRGSFGMAEVHMVSRVQSVYFLQIPFYIPSILAVRVIQALRQHRIIFYGTIISAVLNLGLDLAFLPLMGVAGIALSTVCVYLAALVFLGYWAHRLLKEREAAA